MLPGYFIRQKTITIYTVYTTKAVAPAGLNAIHVVNYAKFLRFYGVRLLSFV